jgi:capsular exopolysaccharide synthesis family protein
MGPSEFSQRLADKYYEIENQMQMLNMQEEYYGYLQSNLHPDGDIEQFLLPAVSDENTGLVTELVNQLIELQKEQELVMSVAASDNQYVKGLEGKWNVAVEMLEKAIGQVKHNITLQKNELRNEINRILVDMEKLPDLEKEFLIIDRTYKLNDAIYTFLLQKHSESQISKASNVPDNEIIDNASVTAIVSPNKNNDYKKGFMLALIIPAAFIGLKEVLNTKVRSKDDLANLLPGVPMVGMIVHNKVDAENVIKDQPHSVISESFRGVRTKLKFMAGNKDMSVIALTSSNTGEGKTFCAQNLASVFAISGKRVVLVGFDMRKPRLTALFDLEKQAGLSNYYIGQSSIEDIIYKPNGQEFAIVPAGPIPPNPSELIAGPKTEELINYLRNKFDVVVVDSPPIGLVADARLLMQYSDCNLFVVRANYTSKDHLNYTMDSILNEPIEHLGVLFNDVNASERGYGYYSAEYYGGKIEV